MKTAWRSVVGVLFYCLFCVWGAQAQSLSAIPHDVPRGPDAQMTPGHLCQDGNRYRYPERVRYCERDVSSEEKDRVFARYQQRYSMQKYSRHQFKIDHLIPLCMGGSNEPTNLWPQHLTICVFTDKIEDLLCKAMQSGMKQKAAIQVLMSVKRDLASAGRVEAELEAQYGP